MTETTITLRHLQELARTNYKSELAEEIGIKLPIIEHSRKKNVPLKFTMMMEYQQNIPAYYRQRKH